MLDHTMAKKKTNDNEAYKNKIFPTDNMTGRAAGQKKLRLHCFLHYNNLLSGQFSIELFSSFGPALQDVVQDCSWFCSHCCC